MEKNITPALSFSIQLNDQYSFKKILIIWALSALPMAVLVFSITPFLTPLLGLPITIVFWLMVIVGLVWQFVLSLLILKHDGYPLNWTTVRDRMRYQKPRDPKTGKANNWLLLWVIPFILLSTLIQGGFIWLPDVDGILNPLISHLPLYDLSSLNAKDYKGAWWLLSLLVPTLIFNYFLGEEFLYRGILLPKMNGVFGKYDWLANGVLFGFYHLHKPQIILSTALYFGFVFAFPAKRFQSSWMAIIIHGLEGLFAIMMVLGVILGKS